MNKYTLAVTSPEYWSEIHDALIVDSNKDGIPDRKVTCADSKEHSPTRGTYELTEAEATEIGNHPHVKWIELSPSHHPGYYPNPQPVTKRFPKDVRIYRSLSGSNAPPSSPSIAEENRTNWAVPRVGVDTHGDAWPGDAPAVINVKTGNIDFSLTGKNVDVIIMDSGVLQYHPEFIDADGKSRVSDIVLDGPYTIDPAYFNTNSLTYIKTDGRVGIATTSAHDWWENSTKRTGTFSSIGTIAINSNYTEAKSIGVGGTIHSITSTHGTRVASLAGGKNFGLAFECNLWNMSAIADPTGTTIETAYDAMKIFHQNKPINSNTGRKNPTLVNGSWGYTAAMTSTGTVNYKFSGSTGSFTGNASFAAGDNSNANLVKAMKEGFLTFTGAYKAWASSSRSNSTDTAGDELMASGVIHVCAAGNDNQRLGIGADDPNRLDYLSDTYYSTTDPRSEFPSGTVPCGHRDWLNPQGIGFDSTTDFHPTICVGVMDVNIDAGYEEYPTYYSNNGPGIDVWAPGDSTLAAGMKSSTGGDVGSSPTYYNRYNSDFVDEYMNGTSAASPVTAGLVALHLESVPSATSREVKSFLDEQGSVHVGNDLFVTVDPNTGIGTTSYWFNYFNLRGARRRILRDRSASSTEPSVTGVFGGESIITSGLVLNLDGNNYTSGTTWTDTSGQGNNVTLVNSPTYSSNNGGYFDFDGTNDYINANTALPDSFFQGNSTNSFWIYFNSIDSDTQGQAILHHGSTSTYNGFQIMQRSSKVVLSLWGTTVESTSTFSASNWYNLTFTHNNTTNAGQIYINGSLNASGTFSSSYVGSGNNCRIAGPAFHEAYHDYLDARISQVLCYERVITASEVLQNYDAMKGRYLDQPLTFSGVSITQT